MIKARGPVLASLGILAAQNPPDLGIYAFVVSHDSPLRKRCRRGCGKISLTGVLKRFEAMVMRTIKLPSDQFSLSIGGRS